MEEVSSREPGVEEVEEVIEEVEDGWMRWMDGEHKLKRTLQGKGGGPVIYMPGHAKVQCYFSPNFFSSFLSPESGADHPDGPRALVNSIVGTARRQLRCPPRRDGRRATAVAAGTVGTTPHSPLGPRLGPASPVRRRRSPDRSAS